ncbi:hypothetical protein DDZ14_03995 [Maritimibacter sp. 55A14]|uniref:hypothetical protein n=1 Tax=Maritimibacter sp. 55A14 TaxID=2174844 RepID=UPI000D60B195|nr:hypothetical protein [Maritimibacter sp. 55A14]PWE33830.1 hypothetical protein DDZ14_03995 [Maritimibacter sp. 55A14]
MTQERDAISPREQEALERAFAAARDAAPPLSAALEAAILRDAVQAAAPRRAVGTPVPWWRGLWQGLGGWPAGAALASAATLGIALGYGGAKPLAGIGDVLLDSGQTASAEDGLEDALYAGYDLALLEDEG